jgi:hypothetical protein
MVLMLAVMATAAPDGKIASSGKSAAPTRLTDFTAWQPIFILRNGVVNTFKAKDFNDSRFEYRWKSEWVVNDFVCTVEVRHTDDVEDKNTLPEIDIFYSSQHTHGRPQRYAAHDVALGGKEEHVFLKRTDCDQVGMVLWSK